MDIVIGYGFQVGIGKTGEAHEQEHIAHGTLTLVFQFYMNYSLQFLFGKEGTSLVFGDTLEGYRLALTSHNVRDTSFLQLKPAWVPLMVIRPIMGALPFFTDWFFV